MAPLRPPSPSPPAVEVADAVLIERFVQHRESAAFEQLLRRHGGMVMGLLRRLRLQEADAEDAFQAAFLTLARKAGAVSKRASLASWLYKVAYRIGLDQRTRAHQRHARERLLTGNEPAANDMKTDVAEFWSLLDAEIMQLGEKERVPFVLCHLEGWSLEEAARQIGCPIGTLGSRLDRARRSLRWRLARRGLTLSAAAMAACLNEQPAQASVAHTVLEGTLQAAVSLDAGAAAISPAVMALSNRAVQVIFLAKVKVLALVAVFVLGAAALAALVVTRWPAAAPKSESAAAPAPERPAKGERENWLAEWGTVIDPAADSDFQATRTTLTVTAAGGARVFGAAASKAPRVVRKVHGDFMVQVKVAPGEPSNPGTFEAGLFPDAAEGELLNASSFAGAGIVILNNDQGFFKLGHGSVFHEQDRHKYLAWHTGSEGAAKLSATAYPARKQINYVRVQRFGPHLFAAVSGDAERWIYLPPVTEELGDVLGVGLLAEHNTAAGFEATFSDYKLTRFNFGNNPRPGNFPPAPKGCARCHGDAVPRINIDAGLEEVLRRMRK
jgi:RNA polymerase sigma factor (sigma-70 family)